MQQDIKRYVIRQAIGYILDKQAVIHNWGNHYYYNGNPKDVYAYPLIKGAVEMLNSDYLPKDSEGNNELPKQTSERFGCDSRMPPIELTIE